LYGLGGGGRGGCGEGRIKSCIQVIGNALLSENEKYIPYIIYSIKFQ
jgi:hypothetical protein